MPDRSLRIRLLLHALDRTGPPMLARSLARWLQTEHPDHTLEIVSFRGGPLIGDFIELGPVHVLLESSEAWDHHEPRPERAVAVRERASSVGGADVMLAVSVAAGQVLPYLPQPEPPLVTWSVEQGEDLHWIDQPVGLEEKTVRWLAGSTGTLDELDVRLPGVDVHLAPEFVPSGPPTDRAVVAHCRRSLDTPSGGLLVVGAGIATTRKAPDLFIEAALHTHRTGRSQDRFVWIGGERDALYLKLLAEVDRLRLDNVRFLGNVEDVVPWLAAADILLHPARLDSFPLVCLHSTLAGTPVVGFLGAGGLEEMLGDALVAAPYPDLAGLVDGIDTLRDPRVRSSVADRQRSRVRARHIAEVAAGDVLLHLTQVAEGSRS